MSRENTTLRLPLVNAPPLPLLVEPCEVEVMGGVKAFVMDVEIGVVVEAVVVVVEGNPGN